MDQEGETKLPAPTHPRERQGQTEAAGGLGTECAEQRREAKPESRVSRTQSHNHHDKNEGHRSFGPPLLCGLEQSHFKFLFLHDKKISVFLAQDLS